ncbi:MAG: hypothetical protein HZB18_14415 [Chloroflexi bacterium]|nr:hypothetical protein [Chloroflexota bacterium]
MKALIRSFFILLVFVFLGALMVVSDTAASGVAVSLGLIHAPRIERQPPPENAQQIRESNQHEKPSLPYLMGRWVLSTGKSVFVISILVVLIVFPKSVAKKIRKTTTT